jgi:AcrR family transcriptional regulator
MRPASGPKERTRERLLSAAIALFSDRGYAATGTRAIAARAGCNVALISHYFGSKEGLLREAVMRALSAVTEELGALIAKPGPAELKLSRFIEFMVDYFDRHREGLQIVHRELGKSESALLDAVGPSIEKNHEMLTAILEEARAAGTLADVEPRTASLLLMGMIQHYFITCPMSSRLIGGRSPEIMGNLKQQITRIFLGGVIKERHARA